MNTLTDASRLLVTTGTTYSGTIQDMGKVLAVAIAGGRKVLFCGNGGSAAEAEHLAAELVVRLRPWVNRKPWPALALTLNMASLTASANDYGYDQVYARAVAALGQLGDVLVVLSTSGHSINVCLALRAARDRRIVTVGLLGAGGGDAVALCDLAVIVPSTVTGRIQEVHLAVGHAILEVAEDMLLGPHVAA